MIRLEDLQPKAAVRGILPDCLVTVVSAQWFGSEALENDKGAGTVGFALTKLQRRPASSPEAIYQSLRRRRERLESLFF